MGCSWEVVGGHTGWAPLKEQSRRGGSEEGGRGSVRELASSSSSQPRSIPNTPAIPIPNRDYGAVPAPLCMSDVTGCHWGCCLCRVPCAVSLHFAPAQRMCGGVLDEWSEVQCTWLTPADASGCPLGWHGCGGKAERCRGFNVAGSIRPVSPLVMLQDPSQCPLPSWLGPHGWGRACILRLHAVLACQPKTSPAPHTTPHPPIHSNSWSYTTSTTHPQQPPHLTQRPKP